MSFIIAIKCTFFLIVTEQLGTHQSHVDLTPSAADLVQLCSCHSGTQTDGTNTSDKPINIFKKPHYVFVLNDFIAFPRSIQNQRQNAILIELPPNKVYDHFFFPSQLCHC